jgi:DNA-binding transcriptional MerR regulator
MVSNKFNDMAEKEFKDSLRKNIIHGSSVKDIKELMQKFNVSEEDVNVAIHIVGRQREKVEEYLQNKASSRFYNIW